MSGGRLALVSAGPVVSVTDGADRTSDFEYQTRLCQCSDLPQQRISWDSVVKCVVK
jgi:hypothetical protein